MVEFAAAWAVIDAEVVKGSVLDKVVSLGMCAGASCIVDFGPLRCIDVPWNMCFRFGFIVVKLHSFLKVGASAFFFFNDGIRFSGSPFCCFVSFWYDSETIRCGWCMLLYQWHVVDSGPDTVGHSRTPTRSV